jgi:hypothetical protein
MNFSLLFPWYSNDVCRRAMNGWLYVLSKCKSCLCHWSQTPDKPIAVGSTLTRVMERVKKYVISQVIALVHQIC